MLEKYLNIQDCLEKFLKITFALKSTLAFYHLQEDSTVFWRPKSVSNCGARIYVCSISHDPLVRSYYTEKCSHRFLLVMF